MTTQDFDAWMLESVAEEHDEMNRSYAGQMDRYPYFSKLKEIMSGVWRKAGKKQLSVIDVGCGAGWQGLYLKQQGLVPRCFSYEGMDISEHMCERARKNFPDGKFQVAELLSWEPGRTWDLCLTCGAIEHFVDWRGALAKLAALSSDWLVVHKLFFSETGKEVQERRKMYQGIEEWRIWYLFDDFKAELEKNGMELVERYSWSQNGVFGVVARRRR